MTQDRRSAGGASAVAGSSPASHIQWSALLASPSGQGLKSCCMMGDMDVAEARREPLGSKAPLDQSVDDTLGTTLDLHFDFVMRLDGLKSIKRRTSVMAGRQEFVGEDSWHACTLALALGEFLGGADLGRVCQMLTVHDLPELVVGDTFVFDESEDSIEALEARGAAELFTQDPTPDGLLRELWREFTYGSTGSTRFFRTCGRAAVVGKRTGSSAVRSPLALRSSATCFRSYGWRLSGFWTPPSNGAICCERLSKRVHRPTWYVTPDERSSRNGRGSMASGLRAGCCADDRSAKP